MSHPTTNIIRIKRAAKTLHRGDLDLIARAIAFSGDQPGFKARVLIALAGYDHDRMNRLRHFVRQLNERELIWVSENDADLTAEK